MSTTKTISLVHIKRVGLMDWSSRKWWLRQQVRIWSGEHGAWWRPNGHGYTVHESQAWIVNFQTAYENTEHCGPEKKINYFSIKSEPPTTP